MLISLVFKFAFVENIMPTAWGESDNESELKVDCSDVEYNSEDESNTDDQLVVVKPGVKESKLPLLRLARVQHVGDNFNTLLPGFRISEFYKFAAFDFYSTIMQHIAKRNKKRMCQTYKNLTIKNLTTC